MTVWWSVKNAEALMDAWNQEQEYQAKRAEEKKTEKGPRQLEKIDQGCPYQREDPGEVHGILVKKMNKYH